VLLHEVRLGDIRFLDITSKDTPSLALPAHMIARVWMEKEELRIQVLDSEWLRQKIRDTGVPHLEVEDEQVILTAPRRTCRSSFCSTPPSRKPTKAILASSGGYGRGRSGKLDSRHASLRIPMLELRRAV